MNAQHEIAMDRDQLIRRFAETVAGDPALLKDGWKHLVLVAVVGAGTTDLMGFCYKSDGRSVPVSPKDVGIFDVVRDLRAAMAAVDAGKSWSAALFRIDRATGKVTAEFEYDRPERWKITPGNAKARAQEFAPA